MQSEYYVDLADIHRAADRIFGHVRTTPLLESPLLSRALGFRLLLKAESLQVTKSFKARGAFNQLLLMSPKEKDQGVVAYSSGNHAQAVAYAAQKLGVRATILMPHDAPHIKMETTRDFGADIVTYNRDTEDRYKVGARLLKERGGRLIHSYDDGRTVAGQGTVGLEIHRQAKEMGVDPYAIIVNCCGGGLAAGIATTLDMFAHKPAIFTAEPEGFDDAARSLTAAKLVKNTRTTGSICDALLMPSMGLNNFRILQNQFARGLTASDEHVMGAMHIAYDQFGLVLEPGGAVSLATAILNRDMFKDRAVVAVATGGNVDPELYARAVCTGGIRASEMLSKLYGTIVIGGPR